MAACRYEISLLVFKYILRDFAEMGFPRVTQGIDYVSRTTGRVGSLNSYSDLEPIRLLVLQTITEPVIMP